MKRIAAAWLLLVLLCSVAAIPTTAAGSQTVRNHTTPIVKHLAPVGRLARSQHLRLAISLPLRNQQALSALLAQLQDPANPNYHKFLTPAQFADRFGPNEQDYAAVATFALAHGLTIAAKYPNRGILDVDGAVSDIEKALHVTMRTYRHPREARQFFAPDVDPTPDLSTPILGINGLDNYELPHPAYQIENAGAKVNAGSNAGSGFNGTYAGYDFRAAYAPSVSLTGSGQTVGLLEFDGYTASDISTYETRAGLPLLTPTDVLLDGYSGVPEGGEVEVSLDIEVAIAMAPGMSKLIVYEAGEAGSWYDMLTRMANDDLAKQMSCSWYIPGGAEDPAADAIFQQMAAQGQSFYAAVGDYDAYTGLIPFPCDTPYVTEVGGTTLTTGGPRGPYESETVWNWGNGVGSGGGISTQYPIPTWQQGVNMATNLGSTTMRNVPDVAMTADNVDVRVNGADEGVGGTSCAAPLWAGFTALINQQAALNGRAPVGFINPAIYALSAGAGYGAAFHDTTAGNDFSPNSPAKFPAEPGYDLCTGWGTPNGLGLIYALGGLPAPVITTGGPLPNGEVGAPYSQTLVATGGVAPYTWSISAGNLPAGLSLSGSGGMISGTPTTPGSTSFTVQVTGSNADASTMQFNLTIYPHGTPVISTASPLVSGTVGVAYNQTFAAAGGAAPYAWSISTGILPPGLSFSGAGLLSGTPTTTGSFGFTAEVSGSDGLTSTTPFAMTVNPPEPVITSALSTTGTVGVPMSYQIVAGNSPTSYSASGLPAGLVPNTATGLITGAATSTGTFDVTIGATNAGGTGTATLTIVVVPDQLSYFTMSNVLNPQIAGAQFPVSITAYDINNIVITAYTGTLSLTATGATGAVAVSPASVGGFVNGVWTGFVAVKALATNVVLTVGDGAGHTVSSNAFNVGTGPLDHFAWSAIGSPQQVLAPFAVTVTAQDAGNNTVTSYSGTASLTCYAGGVAIGVSPGTTGGFTSGVWSGNVTLAQTGTVAVLRATDGIANFYIADSNNSTIREMTAAGVVTTVAGSPQVSGTLDGIGGAARFTHPYGVVVDGTGAIWVADSANCTIRKITAGGMVTTVAGSPGISGTNDGTGSAARFNVPCGMAVDGTGNIYVADTYSNTIRKMTPAGVVTTIGGNAGVTGTQVGVGTAAEFNAPGSLVVSPTNGAVYVADGLNDRVAVGVPTGGGQYLWSNFVGTPGVPGSTDGPISGALFDEPAGLALDGSGNLLVVCSENTVRRVTTSGTVVTIAGVDKVTGSTNGTGTAARFYSPCGNGLDSGGNAYVVDSANSTIRRVTPAGAVTTVAGTALVYGTANGTGGAAQFYYPNGGATDGGGHGGNSNVFNIAQIGIMSVSPAGGLSASGTEGGPFAPATVAYTISDIGTGSMSWSVSGTSTWLSYNQAGGTIASGSSTTLSVTINSTANGLGVGNYGDTITFTNTTNSTGNTTRPAALTVLQPVPAITSALDVTGTNGFGFDYSISASNSPISYNATGLPAGLILSPLTGQISGTLAASGTFNAGISASNAVGTGSAALSITIQASLTGWRNQWFTPAQLADPGISGDTADPAGDGIPNLMKYALDLDPMANGSGGLPAGSMMAIGGSNYIVLTYTQLIAATDLTYIPQVSGDMQTWKSGAGYVAPVSVTPNADGITETVSVRDTTPVSRGAPRFIRLMVTGP